ncbi:MAG: amino acid-binding protein [Lachnospiraceae bacterium]
MMIQQLSVFLENRQGHLNKVLATLSEHHVNIVALSLAENEDYGMLRMVVSDPELGKEVLKNAGNTARLTEVVALRVPHATGSLSQAMNILVANNINVEYMYAFANGEDASAVLKTDEPLKAIELLEKGGFGVWKADEAYKANS